MPLGSFPSGGEGDEPEDAPLLAGGGGQPDGPLMLALEQGDLSEDVEGVDDCGAPSAVEEYFEGVVGEGFCPVVVALQEHSASLPEVGYGPGAPVPQGAGGGQEPLDVDLGLRAVVPGQRHGYQDLLGVPGQVADLRFLLVEAAGPLSCSIEIPGSQGGGAQGVHEYPGPQTQPFLPGLLEISLRPLASGVRRAHAGVENGQDLNCVVPAQRVLPGHHGQRPLTVSAGAGQIPGRESGVCQAPQAPADG